MVVADTLQRPRSPLTGREAIAEGLVGGGFAVAVALLWLLAPPHGFAAAPAIASVLVLVVAMLVRIDTPFGCTVPTQLAFVPLLFALPPALVPVAVLAASLAVRAADVLTGAVLAGRLVQAVSNSWYAVGPAAVFALARTPAGHAGAALLLAALAAQFVVDFGASAVRFAIARGASLRSQLEDYWVYVVDAALSGMALVVAEEMHNNVLAALAPLPLLGVVALFARERHARLTRLVELNDGLHHQAFYDQLTDLPNRILAVDRIEQMLARARRNSLTAAALYIDLDGFKQVNDAYGHAVGDTVLRQIAARIEGVVRDGDTAARLASDEFLVLLEGFAPDAGPESAADRLLEVLRMPHEVNPDPGRQVVVTASIGIAVGGRLTADELLRDADVALSEAKRAGKNRAVLFEASMQEAAHDRLMLEMDLAGALDRDELFLLYQPIVDLRSERVVGVEALIRWRHPTRGIVSPVEFIPLAEESELIIPFGRWVLDEACRQAASWHAAGHRIGMSVNVSARQLDRDELVDEVREALELSRLEPGYLTLEVTETTIMLDAEAAATRLVSLKELGVRIAIDDFGTGYSSLAYLSQFPVDLLKIDRSFVSGIVSSVDSGALVHTLVQLGKTLHLETLAEGIEEPEHMRALQHEQCDLGQGYLFARPLPPAELEEFLELSIGAAMAPTVNAG